MVWEINMGVCPRLEINNIMFINCLGYDFYIYGAFEFFMQFHCLGLNEIYVWFLLPTYPIFFNPTLNIKMVFGEKIPKVGTFSDFVTIFFVK